MSLSLDAVTEEAMNLSPSERDVLVGKLLASLAGQTNPEIERIHLAEIRKRRADVLAGRAEIIDGDETLRKIRDAIRE